MRTIDYVLVVGCSQTDKKGFLIFLFHTKSLLCRLNGSIVKCKLTVKGTALHRRDAMSGKTRESVKIYRFGRILNRTLHRGFCWQTPPMCPCHLLYCYCPEQNSGIQLFRPYSTCKISLVNFLLREKKRTLHVTENGGELHKGLGVLFQGLDEDMNLLHRVLRT